MKFESMIGAWLTLNPAKALVILIVAALMAGLAIRTAQLRAAQSSLSVAVAERAQAQAAALACSDGVAALEADARKRAQEARTAIERARATLHAQKPAIEALAKAEQAAALSCADAMPVIRDALGG